MTSLDGAEIIHAFALGGGSMMEVYRLPDGGVVTARVELGVIKAVSEPLDTRIIAPVVCGVIAGDESVMTKSNMRALALIALPFVLEQEREAVAR